MKDSEVFGTAKFIEKSDVSITIKFKIEGDAHPAHLLLTLR